MTVSPDTVSGDEGEAEALHIDTMRQMVFISLQFISMMECLPEDYSDYHTCCVVFHLKGGTSAQKWFCRRQTQLVTKNHKVEITAPGTTFASVLPPARLANEAFEEIPLGKCTWFSETTINQFHQQATAPIEYEHLTEKPEISVSVNPEVINIHDSDSESDSSGLPEVGDIYTDSTSQDIPMEVDGVAATTSTQITPSLPTQSLRSTSAIANINLDTELLDICT
ncbi:hypothetical protein BDP27DRAFT_1433919 [Rhodocollybia butyracea]|uniref:Uncharacterized protein n=1 Tax=Rhodocollybia butyracea TaxID=206335 RepID=A0A9P5P930_9AGAR|nr:hypothetical protein BDP27DRAFT_1433919 [Rhodocollybia butyracea]